MKGLLPIVVFFFFCRRIALSIDPQFEACKTRNCGSGVNISYPFRILDQPSSCGYPGFEVECKNGRPILNISDNDHYYIENIFYMNQSLLVTNMGSVDGETCPRPTHNLTLQRTPFNISSATVSLLFFFSCTASLPDHIGSDRVYKISCMTNSTHHSYATLADYQTLNSMNFTNDGTLNSTNFTETCESWAAEPVRKDTKYLYGNLDGGNYSEIIKEGFVLEWSTAGSCTQCIQSGGRCGFSESPSQFMCFCPDRPQLVACYAGDDKTNRTSRSKIIIAIYSGSACILLTCLCCCFFRHNSLRSSRQIFSLDGPIFFWKKKAKDAYDVEAFLEKYGSSVLKRYQYSDLKKMTDSFKDKLGEGGYGGVFKGKLFDGRQVAVKVLNKIKGNGEEFINEVASIGRTYHVNIVTLLGFCYEGTKRALIYEFMPNGSLERFIYTEKPRTMHPLGWKKLCEIALGIARGLEYLHRGCSMRILHFYIKPHNILLDQDFCPKISDFGLAKLCPTKESIVSMLGARGTFGYIAPEVYCRNFGGVSYKSDVYSYGMVLLEMVGGRQNLNVGVKNTSEIYFPQWIYKRLDQHGDLALHEITTEVEEETARKMIVVGLWCIQTDPTNRPSMGRVVEMLEGSLTSLPMPPNPFLSSPSKPDQASSTT